MVVIQFRFTRKRRTLKRRLATLETEGIGSVNNHKPPVSKKTPRIRFSHNWSKLDGDVFTTIRSARNRWSDKGEYYGNLEGKVFDVEVKGEVKFQAKLLQVFRGPSKLLSGPFMEYDTDGVHVDLESGQEMSQLDWIMKLEKMGIVLVLLFKKLSPTFKCVNCEEQVMRVNLLSTEPYWHVYKEDADGKHLNNECSCGCTNPEPEIKGVVVH